MKRIILNIASLLLFVAAILGLAWLLPVKLSLGIVMVLLVLILLVVTAIDIRREAERHE